MVRIRHIHHVHSLITELSNDIRKTVTLPGPPITIKVVWIRAKEVTGAFLANVVHGVAKVAGLADLEGDKKS